MRVRCPSFNIKSFLIRKSFRPMRPQPPDLDSQLTRTRGVHTAAGGRPTAGTRARRARASLRSISKGPNDGVRHRASVQVRANASGAPSDSVVRSAALAAETHHRDNTAHRQPACERRGEQPDHAAATARAACASTRLEVATSSERGSQACGARCARIAARASWPCRSRRLRRDQHVLAVRAGHAPRCARMRAPARALRAR